MGPPPHSGLSPTLPPTLTHMPLVHLMFHPSHAPPLAAHARHSEAEPLYRQVLELQQRVLGPEHPDTSRAINELAVCIHSMGRWASSDEAEFLRSSCASCPDAVMHAVPLGDSARATLTCAYKL